MSRPDRVALGSLCGAKCFVKEVPLQARLRRGPECGYFSIWYVSTQVGCIVFCTVGGLCIGVYVGIGVGDIGERYYVIHGYQRQRPGLWAEPLWGRVVGVTLGRNCLSTSPRLGRCLSAWFRLASGTRAASMPSYSRGGC